MRLRSGPLICVVVALLAGSALLVEAQHGAESKLPLTFEVASIKPASQGAATFSISGNRFTAHARLHDLMVRAYGLPFFQVVAPDLTSSTVFGVTATAAAPITDDQLKHMLQSLLISRFGMLRPGAIEWSCIAKTRVATRPTKVSDNSR